MNPAERLASVPPRTCPVCGEAIPATARADVITCSTACRMKRSRAGRREVYFAIRRWLRDGPDGPRQFEAEGITFSVGDGDGTFVWAQAHDGDEHLAVRITQGGACGRPRATSGRTSSGGSPL